MGRFITESELSFEIEKLFKEAEDTLLLVSPYIKLHPRIQSALASKKNIPELKIRLLFGKNRDNPALSLRSEDLKFFTEFPNIEIRYNERLHAKYYANELDAILTSMNLHSFSQDNNIEFGILMKVNLLKDVLNSVTGNVNLDAQAWNFFQDTLDQSDLIFRKEPQFENSLMGLKKTYQGSRTTVDKTSSISQEGNKRPAAVHQSNLSGYCIRTGQPIPFNPDKPMCEEAYKSWAKFSNRDYPEKFCHFSGEQSKGETTFGKPILRKNWTEAKTIHGLK